MSPEWKEELIEGMAGRAQCQMCQLWKERKDVDNADMCERCWYLWQILTKMDQKKAPEDREKWIHELADGPR